VTCSSAVPRESTVASRSNNGYANALQCYVIQTKPMFLLANVAFFSLSMSSGQGVTNLCGSLFVERWQSTDKLAQYRTLRTASCQEALSAWNSLMFLMYSALFVDGRLPLA